MDMLEISAKVSFLKSLPDYPPADCTLLLHGFVRGTGAPEKEFLSLRDFRTALLGLLREGLGQPEKEVGLPWVDLRVAAGEHCADPIHDWHASIETCEEAGRRFWLVTLARRKGPPERFAVTDAQLAVAMFEPVLDRLFSRWASEVVFEPAPRA